jgi:hypothetical protein
VKFDTYTYRARVMPALIAVLPLVLLALFAALSPLIGAIPGLAGVGLAYLFAEVVRERGLALEERLKLSWGGLPTTRMLRFGAHAPGAALTARRAAVEVVTRQVLPSRSIEEATPSEADEAIEQIVRLGIARVRQTTTEAALLQHENVAYGFRRNLLALKPFGLATTGASLIFSLAALAWEPVISSVVIFVDVALGLAWLLVVRRSWVLKQAEKYAVRFFVAMSAIARDPLSEG